MTLSTVSETSVTAVTFPRAGLSSAEAWRTATNATTARAAISGSFRSAYTLAGAVEMAIDEDPEGHEAAALASAGLSFMSRRVLEIGCGDGRLTKYFARVAASVLAIDPDREAIAQLARDLPMVDARPIAIDELVLPAHSVDLVLFSWSL
jgi:2-polyprenyl-3-methyl-5-hydroxy-6-metoxy-1,4-benzoquinol methylase